MPRVTTRWMGGTVSSSGTAAWTTGSNRRANTSPPAAPRVESPDTLPTLGSRRELGTQGAASPDHLPSGVTGPETGGPRGAGPSHSLPGPTLPCAPVPLPPRAQPGAMVIQLSTCPSSLHLTCLQKRGVWPEMKALCLVFLAAVSLLVEASRSGPCLRPWVVLGINSCHRPGHCACWLSPLPRPRSTEE